MQKPDWYYNRLKAMSLGEIGWRIKSCIRDNADKFLVSHRQKPRKISQFLNGDRDKIENGFHVSNTHNGLISIDHGKNHASNFLLASAEKIAAHQLSFFDLQSKYLGDPIRWNRDHKLEKDTPMIISSSLDYRDIKEAGDCKFVWEPNRHHQLVVLGRAYHLTGDVRFAKAAAEQLGSWLRQNPYGLGMNWRSGLELAVRLINWVWTFDLIQDSKVMDEQLYLRFIDSVSRHIWEIDRKYSRGSSVNNHLIGEAAGVFVAASYFRNLKNASVWLDRSRGILLNEIINQTFSDGGTKEQAVGYHFFVMQFFVIAGLAARAQGMDFPDSFWLRLEKMFEFMNALSECSDNLPMFGDCDDGYVLDIGSNPHSIKEWLSVGAAIFNKYDFNTSSEDSEPLRWLPAPLKYDSHQVPAAAKCTSKAFEQTGYYLLQYGKDSCQDCISAVFDCGPLGMGALAGHGHADALSFTLRAFGRDILVDPGTYDYFSYPQWRRYFRSTSAHNTIVVDDIDQSEMLGLFLWGRKAQARCLNWEPSDNGGRVVGEHNGYTNLKDPVIHRRTLELDGCNRELIIRDEIVARKEHNIALFFHFSENCDVSPVGNNRYAVNTGSEKINMILDARLHVELYKGSTEPILGWVSRGYHQKQPAVTLAGRCSLSGNNTLVSKIEIGNLNLPK